MKLIRDIQNNQISKFFTPAIAILFVFSLSLHNHTLSGASTHGFDSHATASHSVEDCSACLLHGNLQVPETGYSFNINSDLGLLIAFISTDFIVPHSFLNLDKPSRAPPIS